MSKFDRFNVNHGTTLALNEKPGVRVLFAVRDSYPYQSIESVLSESGYEVSISTSSIDTIRTINEIKHDFIVLDSMIPGIGAIQICKNIRADPELSATKIIILSDSKKISERLLALNAGSDAFLVMPFEIDELTAKISALQRRNPTGRLTQVLKAGAIEMLTEQWVVYVEGAPVSLTEKEYRLLHELLEVKGRVLTRENLLERVWGHQKNYNLETRTVDVHMSRLRIKLGASGANIITVRNVGYRINFALDWLQQ